MSQSARRFDKSEDHGLVIRRAEGEGVQVGSETLRVIACLQGRSAIEVAGRVLRVEPGREFSMLGGEVRVHVLQCGPRACRMKFCAPREIRILREELALLVA